MNWKYTFCLHTVDGSHIEVDVIRDTKIDNKDELAQHMVKNEFWHSVKGNKLTIINMQNVSYITVTETEIPF